LEVSNLILYLTNNSEIVHREGKLRVDVNLVRYLSMGIPHQDHVPLMNRILQINRSRMADEQIDLRLVISWLNIDPWCDDLRRLPVTLFLFLCRSDKSYVLTHIVTYETTPTNVIYCSLTREVTKSSLYRWVLLM
jgi:hypothetical protein